MLKNLPWHCVSSSIGQALAYIYERSKQAHCLTPTDEQVREGLGLVWTWPGLPWPAGGGNGQGSDASVSVERSPC